MEEETKTPWWAWVLTPFVLILGGLFHLWRWAWRITIIVLLIAVPLDLLGVFDKTPTTEVPNCAGYAFVRELKSEGQIKSFQSVEPESGWRCEYSLNDEEAFVRFKHAGRELQLEIEGSGAANDAYQGASEEAAAKGYTDR